MGGDKDKVRAYLKELKKIIKETGLAIVHRKDEARDYYKCMQELGLTKKTFIEEIHSLSVLDFSEGPVSDIEDGEDLWIFGKEINGKEAYMKFKIFPTAKGFRVKSFTPHKAERPMHYPLKE